MRLVINKAANEKYKNDVAERKKKFDADYLMRVQELQKQRDEKISTKKKKQEDLKKQQFQFLEDEKNRAIAAAEANKKKNEEAIVNQAVANFPMPKVTIKVAQENEPQAVDNPWAIDKNAFSFHKLHADAIQFLRTNVRTVLRIGKRNSPQYEAMKTALDELQNNFPNGMELGSGEDLDALKQNMELYKAALQKVRDNSYIYLNKVGTYQITRSGQERAQNADFIHEMACRKLRAIEEQMKQLETESKQMGTNRENFVLKKTAPEKSNYEEAVKNIEADLKKRKEEAELQEQEANINDAQEAQKTYEEDLKKLNESEETKTQVTSFGDLSDEQKQLFIQAKIASKLFDRRHNPFSDYRSEVAEGQRSYENILDFKNRQYAIELDALKEKINPPGATAKIPITYTPDALLTLSNLRLMDKLMGQEREKNAYQVTYTIFDSNGKPLPTSETTGLDFSKLSEAGYKCLVTAIKADPLPVPDGLQGLRDAKPFQMDEEGIIDKDVTLSLLRFDKEIFLPEDLFHQKVSDTGETLSALLGDRLQQAQDILVNRMNTDDASYGDDETRTQFNITSASQLKKKIASNIIDYRPIRPNNHLAGKTYIKPGIVRNAGNYYDEELIANLGSNNKNTSSKDLDFAQTNDELDREIFEEKKLVLSDKSLISEELKTVFENARKNNDESLQKIETKMQQMQSIDKNTVFTFEENKYISALECEYDKQAGELYGLVRNYLKDHDKDLEDPASPASALQNWKEKAGLDGPRNISFKGKKKDLTEVKIEDDDEYLFQANLFVHGTGNHAKILDVSDKPLFPRRPSLSDIKRGEINDCGFLSVISSMAAGCPEEIENMIKDNGETVTCRFYNKSRQPVLVTVPKTLAILESTDPEDNEKNISSSVTGEAGPLWFHLMEKAYILSGIREEYVDTNSKDGSEMLDKAKEKYNLGSGEPAENVKLRILKECYPIEFKDFKYAEENSTEKKKQINKVNNRIKTLFAKSCFGIAGGEISDAMTILTGSEPVGISLNAASGSDIISALSNLDDNVINFAGKSYKTLACKQAEQEKAKKNKQKRNPKEADIETNPDEEINNESDILCAIGKVTAAKLSLDKITFGTDINGVRFKTVQSISLEELKKALDDAVNDENDPVFKSQFYEQTDEGPKLMYGLSDLSKIKEVKENFVKALHNNQMKNGSPSLKVVSEEPGAYAESAKKIKRAIQDNFNTKKGLNCTFKGAVSRYVDPAFNKEEEKLLLSTEAVAEENKGVFKNHTYTIAGFREDKEGRFYVSLRNPSSGGSADKTSPYAAGTIEMELNQFISIAEDIHIGGVIQQYSRSDVAQALSKEKLNHLRQTNPELYNSKIPNDKILDKAVQQLSESAPIQKAADKFIASSLTNQLISVGVPLPAERVREMEESIKDIKATISIPGQTNERNKDNAQNVQNAQADAKGLV